MMESIFKNARTPLLILAGAGLLSGCAEVKSNMKQIRDNIAELAPSEDVFSGDPVQKTQAGQKTTSSQKAQNSTVKCPEIKIIDALGTFHRFTDTNPPAEDKLISTARIMSLEHECRMTDEGKAQVDISITFESDIGPASQDAKGKTQDAGYPYFVAVTDKKGEILSKDVFELAITPSSNTNTITARETIRQIIPVDGSQELQQYSIAIGFQISDAQLKYNRTHARDEKTDKPTSLGPGNSGTPTEDAHKQIRNMGE
jgi:hypothetical protein